MPLASRMIAARIRRGVARVGGRPAGERDRQVHFIAVPTDAPPPSTFNTLCGDPLSREETDLLDGIAGMPCERCLARVPQVLVRAS